MESTAHAFKDNARAAVADQQLKRALAHVKEGFIGKRAKAAAKLPEFEALRDAARDIKNHTLEHLDVYLEHYERKVTESGGQVHWCPTAEDARRVVLEICQAAGARSVTKGKSMIAEEIGLNDFLDASETYARYTSDRISSNTTALGLSGTLTFAYPGGTAPVTYAAGDRTIFT